MIIAIDGPAGSGKSTVARGVARRLGFTYLDSGALYRAVTLLALERSVDLEDAQALGRLASKAAIELRDPGDEGIQVMLDGRDVSDEIRTPQVTGASSTVAAHPEVRTALLEKQRALIAAGNYVVEGRDIGTVVAPNAPLKLFLTANPDERARRRAAELERKGQRAAAEDVKAAIAKRDRLDSTRSAAPLRVADDAITLDTTGLESDDVIQRVLELVAGVRAVGSS
jgi:cytidylate kinase